MNEKQRQAIVDAFLEGCVTDMWTGPDTSISNLSYMDGDQAVRFRYTDDDGREYFVRVNLVVGLIEDWNTDEMIFESHRDLSQAEPQEQEGHMFQVGDRAWIIDLEEWGTIVAASLDGSGSSYLVRRDHGGSVFRLASGLLKEGHDEEGQS